MSLPDQLTVARVAAVPIVVLLFAWDFPNHAYWATAVFVVAMATDQIDGWLARRRGVSSALVATWVSGLDYARVAPRVLRGENA